MTQPVLLGSLSSNLNHIFVALHACIAQFCQTLNSGWTEGVDKFSLTATLRAVHIVPIVTGTCMADPLHSLILIFKKCAVI